MAISEPTKVEDGKVEAENDHKDGDGVSAWSVRADASAGQDPAAHKVTARARREARLAEALRANLRRRKTP